MDRSSLDAAGSFIYLPAPDFNGADGFTYVANDGSLDSNVATVSLTVTPVNDAPVAQDLALATAEDTSVAGSFVATDVDSAALTFRIVTGPVHGTLALDSAGGFVYLPAPRTSTAPTASRMWRTTARWTRTSRPSR